MRPWGYHLVLDLAKCNAAAIRSRHHIKLFSERLVVGIDMVPFGPAHIVRFGEDDKMGYTLVQLIETSNILAHFCEESNNAFMDVFSCKAFDPMVVKHIVQDHFRPQRMTMRLLMREAELK